MRAQLPPLADGAAFDVTFVDTCVGGSTVAARVARRHAGLWALYFADYSVNPLGVKGAPAVRATLARWIDALSGTSPTLVIACNTASVGLESCPDLRHKVPPGRRLYSMIDLLDRTLAAYPQAVHGRRVCLMGTRFTVGQPVYADRLRSAGARDVIPLAATRSESRVAHLDHATPAGVAAIEEEIGAAIRASDAVLLACTCFPLLADVIRRLNPQCEMIDPAAGIDGLCAWGSSPGPNRLTLAIGEGHATSDGIRASAAALFPGWVVDFASVQTADLRARECRPK